MAQLFQHRYTDAELESLNRLIAKGGREKENSEPRIAKLEATTEFIQREISDIKTDIKGIRTDMRQDFRILFGAIIAVALSLAGIIAKCFGWL